MRNTAIGQITQISETIPVGENGFTKRELILKTIEEYPNFYCIEFHKDKGELLNNFQEGQNVKIHLNIKGREYTNPETQKYSVFHSLVGWRIEELQ